MNEVNRKKEKLESIKKMERFEALEDNEVGFSASDEKKLKPGEKLSLQNGLYKRTRYRRFNLLLEEDFEKKTWDYEQLEQEQINLRMVEGEKRYLKNLEFGHVEGKRLAIKYGGLDKKDRRKALKKHYSIINEDIRDLTAKYKSKKNKLTEKDKLEYEKKLIELNAQAREQFLTGTMVNQEQLEQDLIKNEVRRLYRLARMYFMHIQNKSLPEKVRKKYRSELKKIKLQLQTEAQKIWGNVVDDKDFDWAHAIGASSAREMDDGALRRAKKQYLEDQQEKKEVAEYNQEVQEEIDYLSNAFRERRAKKSVTTESIIEKLKEMHAKQKQRARAKARRPAREHFLRTGVWDPAYKAPKDQDAEQEKPQIPGWHVGEAYQSIKFWLDQADAMDVSDEVFVGLVKKFNQNFADNKKKFDEYVREKGGFTRKFFDDMQFHIDVDYNRPKNKKETPEERKQRHQQKDRTERLKYKLERLEKLGYAEVDKTIIAAYDAHFKHDTINFYPETTALFSLSCHDMFLKDMNNDSRNAEIDQQVGKLVKMADHYELLTEKLRLFSRGPEIYKSPAIERLIVTDELEDKDKLDALLAHTEGLDRLIRRMADSRFGLLSGDFVYRDLLAFLGDKALFSDYRTVRDLSERFMSGLSLTSIRAARIDQDYRKSYTSVMKGIDPVFERSIQQYLKSSRIDMSQEDGRLDKMKKDLVPVKKYLSEFMKQARDLTLTRSSWQKVISLIENGVRNLRYVKPSEVTSKTAGQSIRGLFETIVKEDEQLQGDRFDFGEYRGELKQVREEQRELATDFSFKGMLKGGELLGSKEILDTVEDPELRKFLADHLEDAIVNNPELWEQLPFLSRVRNLDDLDSLSFSEFEALREHLKANLTADGMSEQIKGFLGAEKRDDAIRDMQKEVLLGVFKKRTTVDEMKAMVSRQVLDLEKKEELRRSRLYYLVGRQSLTRNGRVRVRYEDMPDRDKGFLQSTFGKNKKEFHRRSEACTQAAMAWRRLEAIGPEAVKQMRKWIGVAFKEKDDGAVMENLEDLAEMLNYDKDLSAKVQMKASDDLVKAWGKGSADQFRDLIREAITGRDTKGKKVNGLAGKLGIDPEDREIADIKSFILEMSLFDAQDVLYGHDGLKPGGLFAHYGNGKAYRKEMLQDARMAQKRVEMLDKHLEKYAGTPKVLVELRDKLLHTYFSSMIDAHETKKNLEAQIPVLEHTLETHTKSAEESMRMVDEAKRELEAARKAVDENQAVIDKFRNDRDEYEKRSIAYKKRVSKYNKERDSYKERLAEAQKQQQKFAKEFEKKTEKNEKKNKADQSVHVKGQEKMFQEMQELGAEGDRLAKEKQEILDEDNYLTKLKASIENQNEGYNKALDKGGSLQSRLQDAERTVEIRESDISTEKSHREETNEKLQSKMRELKMLSGKLGNEYWINSSLFGFDNLDQLAHHLTDCLNADGEMKYDVKKSVDLIEDRRKQVESYGNGELAVFWDAFLNNDRILADLMNEDQKAVDAKLKSLYETLAPLGTALNEEYSYIAKYFIEDRLSQILSEGKADEETARLRQELKNIEKEAPAQLAAAEEKYRLAMAAAEGPEDEQAAKKSYDKAVDRIKNGKVNFWKKQLDEYRSDYFDQIKQGTSSIQSKLVEAAGAIQSDLAKHFMYESDDTRKQHKSGKAKYRKWWFRTSRNTGVERIAQDHHQTLYQVAMKDAGEVIYNMRDVMLADEDGISSLLNTGDAKAFYQRLMDRYLKNDEKAEVTFLAEVLKAEHGVTVDPDEAAVEKALAELPKSTQDELENLLYMFKKHVGKPALEMKAEEFETVVAGYASEFLTKYRKEQAEFLKNKPQSEKDLEEKLTKRRIARGEALAKKTEGRQLFNKILFGGMFDDLAIFGEKKQSLVYKAPKGKLDSKVSSKGAQEDKELLEAARELFELDDEQKKAGKLPYPEILAVCMDEYCRLNHRYLQRADRLLTKAAGLIDGEITTDVQDETKRLKRIYEIASGQVTLGGKKLETGIPEDAMDMFLVYAAKFAGGPDSFQDTQVVNLAKEFLPYYNKMKELDTVTVSNPSLRLQLEDAREKCRAFLFMTTNKTENTDLKKFSDMVDAQKAFFPYADKAYRILEEETVKVPKIKTLSQQGQLRYLNAIKEYFLGQIIGESQNKAEFNEEAYRTAVQERLKDGIARDALTTMGESVSKEEYERQQNYPGERTRDDFERAIATCRNKSLIKSYNKLNEEERKIFALALYCTKDGDNGTQGVVYGIRPELARKDRAQIISYLRGGEISGRIDYTRAIRAISSKSKNLRVHGDVEAFEAALAYVKQVNEKRTELFPRDYARMTDSLTVAAQGDAIRRKRVPNRTSDFADHREAINKFTGTDRYDFFKMLDAHAEKDVKRQKSLGFFAGLADKYDNFKENKGINKVQERMMHLDAGQRSLLIYILQDRSALDFSTAGKNKLTGIVPHANEEKRFTLYEKLMSETGRMEALIAADSPDMVQKAMQSLLSFQVRDDKELSKGKLKEADFAKDSLFREEAIDWMLLANALDFLDEMEREQRRILAVRQAPMLLLKPTKEMKNLPAVKFMEGHGSTVAYDQQSFEDRLRGAYLSDVKKYPEAEDLMRGYMALTPQEKVLFAKALQHRDILDVSQRNLYKDILGLADRDFVNQKERNELIDDFISTCNSETAIYEMGDASYNMAMLSLLSTQVNDDMAFEKVDGSNWAYKNIKVNNQMLVIDERKDKVLDWKLFERALQLVTRSVAERRQAAGDEALYKNLGDESAGEMKMDRSYMRRNLHHTGSRFMRFLAREGYAQVEDSLGIFETAASYAEFVVSTKTANFLHAQANLFKKPKDEEAEEEEKKEKEEENKKDDKEKEDNKDGVDGDNKDSKKEDAKKEEKKAGFLSQLSSLCTSVSEQYGQLKDMTKKVKETYSEMKSVFIDNEEEEEEEKLRKQETEAQKKSREMEAREKKKRDAKEKDQELDDALGGIQLPVRTKFTETVIKYGGKAANFKEMADKYLKNSPETLETVDKYIHKVMSDKISAKKLGEWYTAGDEWIPDKMDELMPAPLKNAVDKMLDVASTSAECLDIVSGYLDSAVEVLGEFKNIWEAYQNRKSLDESKDKAAREKAGDDEKIANLNVDENTRKLLTAAKEDHVALLSSNNGMVKGIQTRKIVDSVAKLTSKGMAMAGFDGVEKLVTAVADFVNFLHKCMSDKDALMDYYQAGGGGTVEKVIHGQYKFSRTMISYNGKGVKSLGITEKSENSYEITDDGLNQLQHSMGFETREEFADFLRLNMVNSLLFSASKFNPLMQPRILATCALKILGFEDQIGNTDADTADKIFKALKD